MNYQLSENEFNALHSCMNQLDLLTDLCANISGQASLSVDGLQSFLCAQQEVLYATIKAAEARRQVQTELAADRGEMHPVEWMHALRIARGDTQHSPRNMEERITGTLAKSALVDSSMQQVLDEWLLVRAGAHAPALKPAHPPASTRTPARGRARDKLATGAV